MSQRLIYVMDPMCSWCWGFAPVMEQIQQLAPDVPVHFVAGGLRPGRGETLNESGRAALAEHWQAVASVSGQPFATPDELPADFHFNTEPVCRALVVGRELDADRLTLLISNIQMAFYTRAADVGQISVLMDLAEQAGYDRVAFSQAYDAEITRAALAADISWTRDLGIAGFPTLLAQRDGALALLTNGYQSADAVLPLFQRWLAAGQNA